MVSDDVTDAFGLILQEKKIPQSCFAVLKHCTVLLYDRTNTAEFVNKVCRDLFTQKGRQIENIRPSQAALHQHT